MSLLIHGMTRCPVCGLVIEEGQRAVSFPAFVWNEADPLAIFNDASLHQQCFQAHPLREQMETAVAELEAKVGSGRRRCVVCTQEVTDPNDYLLVPRLTSDRSDPLARFSFTHLHRSHVRQWQELGELLSRLSELHTSGIWKGDGLRFLIKELERAAARPS